MSSDHDNAFPSTTSTLRCNYLEVPYVLLGSSDRSCREGPMISLRPAYKEGRQPARPPLALLVIAFVGAVGIAGADVAHRLWSVSEAQSAPAVIQRHDSVSPAMVEHRVAATHRRNARRVQSS